MTNLALTLLLVLLAQSGAPALAEESSIALIELKPWSPRPEISPTFSTDLKDGRKGKSARQMSTDEKSQFGAWRGQVGSVTSGQYYEFSAWYRPVNIAHERRSVIARLEWLNDNGKQVRPPEYAIDVEEQEGWKKVLLVTQAPTNATAVDIQLSLGFAEKAAVLWDEVQMRTVPPPSERKVRTGTIFLRPRGSKSASESVEAFCKLSEKFREAQLDILCLPEGITVVGTGRSYHEVRETIPGPTTERLARLARELNSYVVAGIYETDGPVLYNTSVLLDRKGNIAGKYRKTHLPREEWEAGITPGDDYPVFDTDFGKIGMLICWDVQFPEPWRALGAKGAELVLLPIWGGNETLARARAIENHIYVVSSSYDMRTFVVDPLGNVLVEATQSEPAVWTDIDLARVYYQPWLGNMKHRTWKEWRPDLITSK